MTAAAPRLRATVLVVLLLGLLAGLLTVPLPAAAGQRCGDKYPGTRTASERSLPGDPRRPETPNDPRRSYDYENPGENARGLELPDDPEELREYGTSTKGLAPGSREHAYAAWNRYLATKAAEQRAWNANPVGRKPSRPLSWSRWRSRYVANQGNDARGKAYERLAVREIGLGGPDWNCQQRAQGGDPRRTYDAVNERRKIAYEFKSGSARDKGQLRHDAALVRRGYRVVYVFGQTPTAATLRDLRAAGVRYHVLRATPVVTNANRGVKGADILDPDRRTGSRGSLNDLSNGSGRTAAEAREGTRVDRDLARRSGRPDQAPRAPGGIDWSSLELRHVAETPDGQGYRYAFRAAENLDEANPSAGGAAAARLASDALFTWLALPASSFWVNLNPDEPDRVIDPTFATTDAGRVLLEADLTLKDTGTKLMNPRSKVGRQFWRSLRTNREGFPCYPSYRTWIEPRTATVSEQDGALYILDAPLAVRSERLTIRTVPGGKGCTASEEVLDHNHGRFQELVVPEVERAVNRSPEYADLRRVYLSRVAAEWLRDRNAVRPGAYAAIIDSGDVSRWPARTTWQPKAVYRAYLKDFRTVRFTDVRRVERGGRRYDLTVQVLGGVDFGSAPRQSVSPAQFAAEHEALPATVQGSVHAATNDRRGDGLWLGSEAAPPPAPPARAPFQPTWWMGAGVAAILGAVILPSVLGRRPKRPTLGSGG